MIPPLAIVQARVQSARLPNKMLLPVHNHPVIWHAWTAVREIYDCVVLACPASDVAMFKLAAPLAFIFGWEGPENDVLGRFHACAHDYCINPNELIVRITPDDWPVDVTREVFTLDWLDRMHATVTDPDLREHIGKLLPPRIELNTEADYQAILERPLVSV